MQSKLAKLNSHQQNVHLSAECGAQFVASEWKKYNLFFFLSAMY